MSSANKQILVALVENKPGVLNRVASMMRRRNFNIDSLTVGRTHNPNISRHRCVRAFVFKCREIIPKSARKIACQIENRQK